MGELEQRILAREAVIAVIGLGYVGLPLAVELARAGLRVRGIDVHEARVQAINRGESHIPARGTGDAARH